MESQTVPPDDLGRTLTVARPDADSSLLHLGVVGDTYTILVSGQQTAGKYCLIDMYIPPDGGPPPHRHDFEEMFSILEGEIEFIFRGSKSVLHAGETANVPANAPHQFRNSTNQPARMLCLCAPAGQELFFLEVGEPVSTRTSPPPKPDDAALAGLKAKSQLLAPKYKTELLKQA
jgi:quercetin dioxygenase-like cupin family protein